MLPCAHRSPNPKRHLDRFSCVWATVCKTVRPMLSVRCVSCLSVLSVTLVYYDQTVGWIKMSLGTEVGLGTGHIVLDGTLFPKQWLTAAPTAFRPMTIVTKRSPISAAAELLLHSSRLSVHILYNGRTSHPQNCPFPRGSGPHLIHDSLSPSEPSIQMAS